MRFFKGLALLSTFVFSLFFACSDDIDIVGGNPTIYTHDVVGTWKLKSISSSGIVVANATGTLTATSTGTYNLSVYNGDGLALMGTEGSWAPVANTDSITLTPLGDIGTNVFCKKINNILTMSWLEGEGADEIIIEWVDSAYTASADSADSNSNTPKVKNVSVSAGVNSYGEKGVWVKYTPVTGYVTYYAYYSAGTTVSTNNTKTSPGVLSGDSIFIGGIFTEDSTYTVAVIGEFSDKVTSLSDPVTFVYKSTGITTKDTGTVAKIDSISYKIADADSSITISWKAPEGTVGAYFVYYRILGESTFSTATILDSSVSFKFTANFKGITSKALKLDSTYQFYVKSLSPKLYSDTIAVKFALSSTSDSNTVVKNIPPAFPAKSDTAILFAELYTDTVSAIDSNGDTLSYSLLSYPTGMVLSDSIISWTPITLDTSTVKVIAKDGKGGVDTLTWKLTVILTDSGTTVAKAYKVALADTSKLLYTPAGSKFYLKITVGANEYIKIYRKNYLGISFKCRPDMKLISSTGDTISSSHQNNNISWFETNKAGEYIVQLNNTSKYKAICSYFITKVGDLKKSSSRFFPDTISVIDSSNGVIAGRVGEGKNAYYAIPVKLGDTLEFSRKDYTGPLTFHKPDLNFTLLDSVFLGILVSHKSIISEYTGYLLVKIKGSINSELPFSFTYSYHSVSGGTVTKADTSIFDYGNWKIQLLDTNSYKTTVVDSGDTAPISIKGSYPANTGNVSMVLNMIDTTGIGAFDSLKIIYKSNGNLFMYFKAGSIISDNYSAYYKSLSASEQEISIVMTYADLESSPSSSNKGTLGLSDIKELSISNSSSVDISSGFEFEIKDIIIYGRKK